jgi:hypothetical protein
MATFTEVSNGLLVDQQERNQHFVVYLCRHQEPVFLVPSDGLCWQLPDRHASGKPSIIRNLILGFNAFVLGVCSQHRTSGLPGRAGVCAEGQTASQSLISINLSVNAQVVLVVVWSPFERMTTNAWYIVTGLANFIQVRSAF